MSRYTSNFTKAVIIVEFCLVAYLLYSLTQRIYTSYKIDKTIEVFRDENRAIEEENRRKNEDYLYFTSEEYIDKIAKQNLGLVNRGEEVIILAPDVLEDDLELQEDDLPDIAENVGLTVRQQWVDFFFGD